MCAECQRTEHRQRCGDAPGLPAQAIGQSGDQHHPKRLHGVTGTSGDEDVVALRLPQWMVGSTIDVAIDRLRPIQQHVTNATQAFLQCFKHLRLFVGDAPAITM